MYTLNTQHCLRERIWHQSQQKTPWITFRGHSRSCILRSYILHRLGDIAGFYAPDPTPFPLILGVFPLHQIA